MGLGLAFPRLNVQGYRPGRSEIPRSLGLLGLAEGWQPCLLPLWRRVGQVGGPGWTAIVAFLPLPVFTTHNSLLIADLYVIALEGRISIKQGPETFFS